MTKYKITCKKCQMSHEIDAEDQGYAEFEFGRTHSTECSDFQNRCVELAIQMNEMVREEFLDIQVV